jgi:hypothetical protein
VLWLLNPVAERATQEASRVTFRLFPQVATFPKDALNLTAMFLCI